MKASLQLYLLIVLITLLSSCRKDFTHEDVTIAYPCKCCLMEDSIVGTYEGLFLQKEFSGFIGTSWAPKWKIITDTIVQIRIYKAPAEDEISDSLRCKYIIDGYVNHIASFSTVTYDPVFYPGITYAWYIQLKLHYYRPYSASLNSLKEFNLIRKDYYTRPDGVRKYYEKIKFSGLKL